MTYIKKFCESKSLKLGLAVLFSIILYFSFSTVISNATENVDEIEPNDTKAQAQEIKATTETAASYNPSNIVGRYRVHGETSSTDADWFKVHLREGTHYVCCSLKSLNFYIEDANGNSIYDQTFSSSDDGQAFAFNVKEDGYYLIEILGTSEKEYWFTVGNPIYKIDSCMGGWWDIRLETVRMGTIRSSFRCPVRLIYLWIISRK